MWVVGISGSLQQMVVWISRELKPPTSSSFSIKLLSVVKYNVMQVHELEEQFTLLMCLYFTWLYNFLLQIVLSKSK